MRSSSLVTTFVTVEVVDVTQTFLVEQLERQQTEQRICGRNHLCPWVTRRTRHLIKSQLREEWQEEKDSRVASDQSPASFQRKCLRIGDWNVYVFIIGNARWSATLDF